MNEEIPKGFCQCGCGGKTNIASYNYPKYGHVKGEPVRFIKGHPGKKLSKKREEHPNWKGGIRKCDGYTLINMPTHYRADALGYVREHILICERVLGKPLPPQVILHHVNEDKEDNRHSNLVICQDKSYHNLLHQRMRALKASGHANWLKCPYCKQWDDPAKMYVEPDHNRGRHRECQNARKKKH